MGIDGEGERRGRQNETVIGNERGEAVDREGDRQWLELICMGFNEEGGGYRWWWLLRR